VQPFRRVRSGSSRLAEYHFEVSHAPGETVLCPGKLSAGASRTRCDLARGHEAGDAHALAPTYSSVGVASDPLWKRNPLLTTNGGLNVVFYEVPGGAIAESLDKPSISEFFDWISGYLGPFPYGDELRFAGAPTHWLGFEHPANIVLYEKLQTVKGAYANPTMHVVMHETTHQWAGNRATLASVGDFVWKEATAEYLSYVFERDHRPAGEAEGHPGLLGPNFAIGHAPSAPDRRTAPRGARLLHRCVRPGPWCSTFSSKP